MNNDVSVTQLKKELFTYFHSLDNLKKLSQPERRIYLLALESFKENRAIDQNEISKMTAVVSALRDRPVEPNKSGIIHSIRSLFKGIFNLLNWRVSSSRLVETGWDVYLGSQDLTMHQKLEEIHSAADKKQLDLSREFLIITDYIKKNKTNVSISDIPLLLTMRDKIGPGQIKSTLNSCLVDLQNSVVATLSENPEKVPDLFKELSDDETSEILKYFLSGSRTLEENIAVARAMGPRLTKLVLNNADGLKKGNLNTLIEACPNLKELEIRRSPQNLVTSEGSDYMCLANLKDLKSLIVDGMVFNEGNFLTRLTGLESLKLQSVVFPCDEFNKISSLENLKILNLSGCLVTNETLRLLSTALPKLDTLVLKDCQKGIDSEGWDHLSKFEHLSELDLENTNLSDQGLIPIAGLKNLRRLNLKRCPITDKGLETLSTSSSLVDLNLHYCVKITDKGMESIAKMKGLKSLDINNSYITLNGLNMIRENLQLDVLRYDWILDVR